MQVQFGTRQFTKTKFDGLDGKTVVGFATDGDEITARITKSEIDFKIEATATTHVEVADLIHTIGQLVDACWKEHRKLQPKLATSISGH